MSYSHHQFKHEMRRVMDSVKTVLDRDKNPQFLSDVPHEYNDKFTLVQALSADAISAVVQVLRRLGLTKAQIQTIVEWTKTRKVTLRMSGKSNVEFLRRSSREVESKTKLSTKSSNGTKNTTKLITTVDSFHWNYTVGYKLIVFPGANQHEAIEVTGRTGQGEIVTSTKTTPSRICTGEPTDADVTHLFEWIGSDASARSFKIDRSAASCKTPRRNDQVEQVLNALGDMSGIVHFFLHELMKGVESLLQKVPSGDDELAKTPTIRPSDAVSVSKKLFIPVVPIVLNDPEKGCQVMCSGGSGGADGSWTKFSDAHQNSLDKAIAEVEALCCSPVATDKKKRKQKAPLQTWVTATELKLSLLALHIQDIVSTYVDSVENVETLIRTQLIDAIGSIVGTEDISQYMGFHNRRLFKKELCPTAMLHDVRRAGFTPEGCISIERFRGTPIATTSRTIDTSDATPMTFPLTASTDVQFLGKTRVHGHMAQQFSSSRSFKLTLVARARQFSSFVLMIGTVVSTDRFEPKHAVILQNKDELEVVLDCVPLPTAKEFRKAVASLSTNQQEFAQAYRKMQLSSTLFGVCVVPIKPLMERLLNLPPGGLAKEIKLTQDLMRLFVEYQVPSDLLTFAGPEDASLAERLSEVKEYRDGLLKMIDASKASELKEKKQQREFLRKPASRVYEEEEECDVGGGNLFGSDDDYDDEDGVCYGSLSALTAHERTSAPTAGAARGGSTSATSTLRHPAEDEDFTPSQGGFDVTQIPSTLDRRFDEFDNAAKVRPTTIKVDDMNWTLTGNQGKLLGVTTTRSLGDSERTTEKNKAMDLIDALSRSGEILLTDCELHVIVAMTHCFDETVMNMLVREDENPISALENSALLLSSVIMDKPVEELVDAKEWRRLADSPVSRGLLDKVP